MRRFQVLPCIAACRHYGGHKKNDYVDQDSVDTSSTVLKRCVQLLASATRVGTPGSSVVYLGRGLHYSSSCSNHHHSVFTEMQKLIKATNTTVYVEKNYKELVFYWSSACSSLPYALTGGEQGVSGNCWCYL